MRESTMEGTWSTSKAGEGRWSEHTRASCTEARMSIDCTPTTLDGMSPESCLVGPGDEHADTELRSNALLDLDETPEVDNSGKEEAADYGSVWRRLGIASLTHVAIEAMRADEELPVPAVGAWVETKASAPDAPILQARVVARFWEGGWVFRLKTRALHAPYRAALAQVRSWPVWSRARARDCALGRRRGLRDLYADPHAPPPPDPLMDVPSPTESEVSERKVRLPPGVVVESVEIAPVATLRETLVETPTMEVIPTVVLPGDLPSLEDLPSALPAEVSQFEDMTMDAPPAEASHSMASPLAGPSIVRPAPRDLTLSEKRDWIAEAAPVSKRVVVTAPLRVSERPTIAEEVPAAPAAPSAPRRTAKASKKRATGASASKASKKAKSPVAASASKQAAAPVVPTPASDTPVEMSPQASASTVTPPKEDLPTEAPSEEPAPVETPLAAATSVEATSTEVAPTEDVTHVVKRQVLPPPKIESMPSAPGRPEWDVYEKGIRQGLNDWTRAYIAYRQWGAGGK